MSSYLALKDLALNYDRKEEEFLSLLHETQSRLFCRDMLSISITAEDDNIARFAAYGSDLVNSLDKAPQSSVTPNFVTYARNQAFYSSSEVVYNVKGCTLFNTSTQRYNGHFDVLKTWLSRDYLWNTVRQAGGAYGCFVQFNQISGNFAVVSYRDPQVQKTYAAYDSISERVENLAISQQGLQQLIIGAYGNFNPHQGPAAKGATARNEYLSGITPEYKRMRLGELLTTTNDDLKKFAPLFKNLVENGCRATIGNKEKIMSAKSLFDTVEEI
jgi:Zn-dependent M16 (insulinase) family peptidase